MKLETVQEDLFENELNYKRCTENSKHTAYANKDPSLLKVLHGIG